MLYPGYEARKEILRVHTSVVRKVPLSGDVSLGKATGKTVSLIQSLKDRPYPGYYLKPGVINLWFTTSLMQQGWIGLMVNQDLRNMWLMCKTW